jgi:hypothetical protein
MKTLKDTIQYAGHSLNYTETLTECGQIDHIDYMQHKLDHMKREGVIACWTHEDETHHLWTDLKPLQDLTAGNTDNMHKALEFAAERKDHSLVRCLARLMLVDFFQDTITQVSDDYSTHSFYFVRYRKLKEGDSQNDIRVLNGDPYKFAGNGGIIYHGKHDNGGDGSAPTFSVNMTPVNGWSVHT